MNLSMIKAAFTRNSARRGIVISKFKAVFALLTGGITGILKYFLNVFNVQILGKIKDKAMGLKYLKDVQAVHTMAKTVLENHAEDLSETQRKRGDAILAALNELIEALEDFEVDETEFSRIVARVNAAIDAFKKAN